MVGRSATLEDVLKALDKLRGDDNLGYEHQHVTSCGEGIGNKVYVYFGLSRTRNAV